MGVCCCSKARHLRIRGPIISHGGAKMKDEGCQGEGLEPANRNQSSLSQNAELQPRGNATSCECRRRVDTDDANMSAASPSASQRSPQFPTHNCPRCWLITDALNPLAVRLIRLLLAHGDHIAAGLPPSGLEDEERATEFKELIAECKSKEGWIGRIRGIRCDGRKIPDCQTAIAEAQQLTGRIDILLLSTSEGYLHVPALKPLTNT